MIDRILILTSCNFFFESRSTDRKVLPGCGQNVQKKLVLVCEGSLHPRKLLDVNGPGLGEAGRYSFAYRIDAYRIDASIFYLFPCSACSKRILSVSCVNGLVWEH